MIHKYFLNQSLTEVHCFQCNCNFYCDTTNDGIVDVCYSLITSINSHITLQEDATHYLSFFHSNIRFREDDKWFLDDYRCDEYQNKRIMKLLNQNYVKDDGVAYNTLSFERDAYFFDYVDYIFHDTNTNPNAIMANDKTGPIFQCPYCGSLDTTYRTWRIKGLEVERNEFFDCESSSSKISQHEMHIFNLITDLKAYEDEQISNLPIANKRIDNKEFIVFLKSLFDTESDIYLLKEYLCSLTKQYIDVCFKFKREVMMYEIPHAITYASKAPDQPTYEEVPKFIHKKAVEKRNEEAYNAYNEQCRSIVEQYLSDREKYLEQSRQLEPEVENAITTFAFDSFRHINPKTVSILQFLSNEIKICKINLHDLICQRKRLYATNLIYGKYRDIVAVATFLEYFESGRCDSLSGPFGAYNMFEDEQRASTIIAKLDVIIKQLEEIKNNQHMIYTKLCAINEALNRMNSRVSDICNSISDIRHNTVTMAANSVQTAEYSKITANNTSTMLFLNMYDAIVN